MGGLLDGWRRGSPRLRSRRIRSLAEYGGADAHHSSAFFDGRFEIVAHSHRELSQLGTRDPFRDPRIAQFPQPHEPRSGLFLILVPWRNQHQAGQASRTERLRGIENAPGLVGGRAELRRFSRQIDLNQDLGRSLPLGRRGVHLSKQLDRVDRMDAVKAGRGFPGLVRLQVADEMPPDRDVGRVADFLQSFLDFVFPEVLLACGVGGANRVGAECLGDRNEADGRRIPAGAAGGRMEPGPDRLEVSCDGGVHGGRQRYLIYAFNISAFAFAFSALGPLGASFRYVSNSLAASGNLPRFKSTCPSMKCASAWFGLDAAAAANCSCAFAKSLPFHEMTPALYMASAFPVPPAAPDRFIASALISFASANFF